VQFGERAIELHPDFPLALLSIGLGCCRLGEHSRGVEVFERLVGITARAPLFVGFLGLAYALSQRSDAAEQVLEELKRRAVQEYILPHAFVLVHLGLKDPDKIYESLTAHVESGVSGYPVQIFIGPFLNELPPDPRFADLCRRLRLLA
jgi:hypothetical protein